MVARRSRFRSSKRTEFSGGFRLTLAQGLVTLETIVSAFARPLLLAGFFLALAWLGVFSAFYPWAHALALALFVAVFFDALGQARLRFRPATKSMGRRRLEAASGLKHRPLDLSSDRLAVADEEQAALWQVHLERSRAQLKNLRWPRWKLSFADRDPYALRYAFLLLLSVGLFFSWGAWGNRLLAAVNPAIGPSINLFRPALDAWITPPDYTGLPPIMIATPAGTQHENEVLDVPAGSTIAAHLAEKSGEAPDLLVNDQTLGFTADDHEDFGATATITGGDTLSIRRGWQKWGSWRIRVIPNRPPQIALTEPVSVTERKNLRLAWQATDDYGVADVTATVTPRESLPGASDKPVTLDLATPDAKDVKRISYADLTASPWAGLSVQIQLTARDAAGHTGTSEPVDFVLPERVFFHPLARALIEERKRLLLGPDDDNVRNEAANVMAGIAAHRPADYRNDPVVAMALRAGAVRLVLDRSAAIVPSVIDILWQTAVRIEDGAVGMAEANLRQAQKELADALDRNASQAEIQQKIDRLHQALAQYLAQLSAQAGPSQPASDLEQALGEHTNMITPEDLDRMLEQMRDLSASGARDQARNELARLQQLLENLRTDHPQLTADQQKALKRIAALRELSQKQRQLLDETFREAQDGKSNDAKLAVQQEDLHRALRSLMESSGKDETDDLERSDQAMKNASSELGRGSPRDAVSHQNEALAAMQQALQSMADSLHASMFMLPRPGSEAGGQDPFGRSGFGGYARDDGTMRVPDRMEARHVREILDELQRRAGDSDRSKLERDYIDRLLQNF
jgi:uncharacterized protein (TIGR02302 family)